MSRKITKQDMINSDINEVRKQLEGYVEIHAENYEDIECGLWIKYISNQGKFRNVGVLVKNKATVYFMLKNPKLNKKWSVNLNGCRIFLKNNEENTLR